MAHITGGGIPENLPRCVGKGRSIRIAPDSWEIPPVFQWLQQTGNVSKQAMWDTFNLGIGFVIILPANAVKFSLEWFRSRDLPAYQIGEVVAGNSGIVGID